MNFGRDIREENEKLRDTLVHAKDRIEKMEDFFSKMENASLSIHGYVISVQDNRVLVGTSNGIFEGVKKDELTLTPGKQVKANRDNGLVIDESMMISSGKIYTVISCNFEEKWAEIDAEGTTHRISTSSLKNIDNGDKILVDPSLSIAIDNYGKDQKRFSYNGETGVQWDDIGGLKKAKDALKEAIELPAVHPELFKKYGKTISKGVMLYGPTGCGKTLLAKAAATSLAQNFGSTAKETGFIYIKGPELLDKWVGNTEAMIRSLFSQARDHKKRNGYPAILFIDEAEALLTKRGSRDNNALSQTIVPQFLSEMDGLNDSGAFVLLATNCPDIIDPAIVRDGRIDRKVLVGRPDKESASEILKIHLKEKPLSENTDLDTICKEVAEIIYSDHHIIYDLNVEGKGEAKFYLRDLVNGAMLAGVADKSSSNALMRDIASNRIDPSGIEQEDINLAIRDIILENSDLNHDIAIQEFEQTIGGKVTHLRKVNQNVSLVAS